MKYIYKFGNSDRFLELIPIEDCTANGIIQITLKVLDKYQIPIKNYVSNLFTKGMYIHTNIIGHYNPLAGIIDLGSHTTFVVCINFIHK